MLTISNVPTSKDPAQGLTIQWGEGVMVVIVAEKGIVACGAIDVDVMDEFGYTIAVAKGTPEHPLKSPEDVLTAKISKLTGKAGEYGIEVGMNGREALDILTS